MNIQCFISMAESKLQSLNTQMAVATTTGNTDEMQRLQPDIDETETTLAQLRGLLA